MASKKENSSDESMNLDPYISDTRTYSDFVLYFASTGRFQHNSLLDHDRRKGVLSLLQSERVIKLTTDRRLSPVNVSFTPGGRKQRVYLVAIVRSGVGTQELDRLVAIMNKYLEGLPMDEREQTVVDLIFSTRSRVIPGVRYLPLHWYPAEGDLPPDIILDEDNRRVDNDGRPILDTDDETVAIVHGEDPGPRNRQDVPMPSATAVLSDPSTDSERGPGTYKKKRKVPPHEWPVEEDEMAMDEPETKKPKPEPESQGDEESQATQPPASLAPEDVITIDDDLASVEALSDSGQQIITREELNRELTRVVSGFGELKKFVQDIAEQRGKTTSGVSTSQESATKSKKQTRGKTPEYVNDAESKVLALFPINYYSKAMDWLNQQPIVQDLIYYEVMRIVYRLLPVFKPDSNQVLEAFMDAVMSVRLQSHMGKPTPRHSQQDYGRFSMPMVFLKIAQDRLAGLGRLRAPGSKDVADFMKDRCTGQRRNKVLCGPFTAGSASVQQFAHRILNERLDFAEKHKWIFENHNKKNWDFATELAKTKKLETSKKFPNDSTFDGDKVPFEPDIEYLIFPDMDKGQELDDMDLAKSIVADLEARGLTIPTFPRHVWDTITMIVQPSPLDLAKIKKIQDAKAATRRKRLARRREKYAKKKEHLEEQDEEGDTDEEEEQPGIDEDQEVDDPTATAHGSGAGGAYQMDPLTREDHIRGLFGSVSDVSSDTSKGSNDNPPEVSYNITKEGVMQFIDPTPGPSSDVAQVADPATAVTQDVPVSLPTTEIMKAAEASGLVGEESAVYVACDQTATTNNEFSIVVRSPTDQEPVVVTRESSKSNTVKETLTKPAKQKTAIQRYQDMEESALDQAALEGLPSSSSSSNDGGERSPRPEAQDANGQVIAAAMKPEAIFKAPLPVTKRSVTKHQLAKGPKDDDMADFKAPFKPPRPVSTNTTAQGHSHGTRSKSKAAKKQPKDKKGKSKGSRK